MREPFCPIFFLAGLLYSYAAMILPPWLGATAAWSLLLAYVMASASNIGGFYYYAN